MLSRLRNPGRKNQRTTGSVTVKSKHSCRFAKQAARLAASLFTLSFRGSQAGSLTHTARQQPFSIQQQAGNAWLTKPNGERFFSFGVCGVDMGASGQEFALTSRGYAAW